MDLSQQKINKTYSSSFLARYYKLGRFFSFWGQDQKARRYGVEQLGLKKGDRVLDLPCGPGMELEHILKYIGPEGKIVAFDYSPEMLRQARVKAAKNNWQNIEFVQGDAAKISYENEFDAAVITLGLTVIPDWQEALKRIVQTVKPYGGIVIIDGKPLGGFLKILNPWVKLVYRAASATWGRDIIGEAKKYLSEVKIKEFLLGGLFVLLGKK